MNRQLTEEKIHMVSELLKYTFYSAPHHNLWTELHTNTSGEAILLQEILL